MTLVYPIFFIVLFLISYQDFKSREVSLTLYLLSIIIAGFIGFSNNEKIYFLKLMVVNFSIIGFTSILLVLYLFIRNGLKISFFNFVGKGDLLFFVTIALSFSPFNFIIFQICSFLLILFINFILNQIKGFYISVPLAGYQALFLVIAIITEPLLKSYSRFDEPFFLGLLN